MEDGLGMGQMVRWWDCPQCGQGNDLDVEYCQDCNYYRWNADDPQALERMGFIQPKKEATGAG
jgi:hypothetical protein